MRRSVLTAVATILLITVAVVTFTTRLSSGLVLADRPQTVHAAGTRRTAASPTCLALPRAIRENAAPVAALSAGALTITSLSRCTSTTVISVAAQPPVIFSPDRRWVAEGAATVSSAAGGQVQEPLGSNIWNAPGRETWSWSPQSDQLAGITNSGAVIEGRLNGRPVTLEPAGWGATSLAYDGARNLIVTRRQGQVWRIPLDRSRPVLLSSDPSPYAAVQIALVTNDAVIAWRQPYLSASAAADGAPLERISLRTGRRTPLGMTALLAPGYVVGCGSGIAVVAGAGRGATAGKEITVLNADWQPRRIGPGVSPSCSADGREVAFALGRPERGLAFGNERRRIEVVGPRYTGMISVAPRSGPGASDPMLAADGRTVKWISSVPGGSASQATYAGALEAAVVGAATHRTGPILSVGPASDFYGTLYWPLYLSIPGRPQS